MILPKFLDGSGATGPEVFGVVEGVDCAQFTSHHVWEFSRMRGSHVGEEMLVMGYCRECGAELELTGIIKATMRRD